MNYLSPEEREEYDALIEEAGFDEFGGARPSGEIGERMHALLRDAEQAGRPWAEWMLREDAEAGHLKRFKAWDKARRQIKIVYGDLIVPKAAVTSVRKTREDGSTYHQLTLWQELTWAEIEQKYDEATAQRHAASITVRMTRRLLALRDKAPHTVGPSAACAELGIDFDEYLTSEGDAA